MDIGRRKKGVRLFFLQWEGGCGRKDGEKDKVIDSCRRCSIFFGFGMMLMG